MKAFSIDLRQRIVDAVKGGESMASASRRFEIRAPLKTSTNSE